jgi:V8-like Glu-specific endopeptidase
MTGPRARRALLLLTAVAALLVPTASAQAIVGPSTPDAAHPNVGVLLPIPQMPVARYCGATPISSRVLVLAGHCAALRLATFGESRGTVTFDPDIRADVADFGPGWTYAGGWPTYDGTLVAHPAWGTQGQLSWDVAVLVLDVPLPASVRVEPLPAAGRLDALKAAGALADETFTLVGYGNTERLPSNVLVGGGQRRSTSQIVTGMTQQLLRHQGGAGGGTACTNDSGSPLFRDDQLVGVLSQGDAACASLGASVRLDVPEVRDWLVAQVVAAT